MALAEYIWRIVQMFYISKMSVLFSNVFCNVSAHSGKNGKILQAFAPTELLEQESQ